MHNRDPEVATPVSPTIAPQQTRGFVAALLRDKEHLPEVQPVERQDFRAISRGAGEVRMDPIGRRRPNEVRFMNVLIEL